MIEQLSPNSRRLVAVGILVFIVLAMIFVAVLPLLDALITARRDLVGSRSRLARVEALASRPPARLGREIPANLLIVAPDPGAAKESLKAMIEAAATRNGVALQRLDIGPDTGSPNRLQMQLSAQGPEINLIRFIHEVEHGRPLIRFRSWTLGTSGNEPPRLMLEGNALAVWSKAQ